LVVIAIIAVLAAILFPVMSSTKKRAQGISCLNNMKQIGTAHSMYIDSNNGTLVPVGLIGIAKGKLVPDGAATYWPDLLSTYSSKSGNINRCAMSQKKFFGIGMNHPQLGYWVSASSGGSGCRLSAILRPTKTICFGDTGLISRTTYRSANPDKWIEAPLPDGSTDLTIVMRTPDNKGYYDNPSCCTRLVGRHNGQANCSFVDGHCEAIPVSKAGFQYPEGDSRAMWDKK